MAMFGILNDRFVQQQKIPESFRINQSTLRKQGWALIYSLCFQRVTFKKNIQGIVFKNVYRIYNFHTFREQESSSN